MMRAGARKRYNKYKPIIIHSSGRTEVIGSHVCVTDDGRDTTLRSGKTFTNRIDAIDFAQQIINLRTAKDGLQLNLNR